MQSFLNMFTQLHPDSRFAYVALKWDENDEVERFVNNVKRGYVYDDVLQAHHITEQMVLDLRDADKSDILPSLCAQYGLEYFHYPIDNAKQTVMQMIEKFPQFCEEIDKGDFYIACAMGLHRTDIALCTYWVFYAADKGIAPPPIRGYKREDGHNTNKIMRVLNAFYQCITDRDGKEPIPVEVFKERKKVINELSKD